MRRTDGTLFDYEDERSTRIDAATYILSRYLQRKYLGRGIGEREGGLESGWVEKGLGGRAKESLLKEVFKVGFIIHIHTLYTSERGRKGSGSGMREGGVDGTGDDDDDDVITVIFLGGSILIGFDRKEEI